MKRLIADILLIVIIVALGKMIVIENDYGSSIDEKIASFDHQVANNKIIEPPKNIVRVNQVDENFAGDLGNKISDVIYNVVRGSVETISTIFDTN